MLGEHPIRAWASTQYVFVLSSGEAEYYPMLKGASHGLGTQSMLADFGLGVTLHLATDSAAAKGIAGRKGLGKTRHMQLCYLCLQDQVAQKRRFVHKIPGAEHPADLCTK